MGRKIKDKMTGKSNEERVAERRKRKEEEMKAYQEYIRRRKAIIEAQRDGRYQPMYGPPSGMYSRPVYASPYGYGGGMYGRPMYGGYGYGR